MIELAKTEIKDFYGCWGKCFEFEEKHLQDDPNFEPLERKLTECSNEFIAKSIKRMSNAPKRF